MTIKKLFEMFPDVKSIHWVDACDWMAGGHFIRHFCARRQMNLRVRSWERRGGCIHCVLEP